MYPAATKLRLPTMPATRRRFLHDVAVAGAAYGLLPLTGGAAAQEPGQLPGFAETERAYRMWDGTLHDEARNRDLPFRLYVPDPLVGPYPTILVSHGVGGSRDAMPYLGRHLARNGYVALHLQHPGTDNSVWRPGMPMADVYRALLQAMWDAKAARLRFQDVPFALDQLSRWNSAGPLAGHLDLTRTGMAGHSYGGVSTMVAAGQRMGPGGRWFFKDPRIRAGVVMSPNVPIQGGDLAKLYRDVDVPLFHITGTKDGNAVPGGKDFDPVQRTIPYETLAIPRQYLLVLEGADHNAFSGLEHGPHAHGPERETRHTRLVQQGAVLFFDAYVKGSAQAETALRNDYPRSLTTGDRFQWK